MKVLITGGAGFIGGHLAEAFTRGGHEVVAFDNFEPFYDVGIKEHNVEAAQDTAANGDGNYELVEGDVRDEERVNKYVGEADVVFHQAAQAGVRASVKQPQKVDNINVSGTLNVLEAARNSDTKRVIVASSSSVYGKSEYLPYDEEHPTAPVSPYGVSKLAQEQYARVYNEVYGLSTVSLRYFTVYGPRMRPNMAISNFVSRCLNNEPPVIYGDGTQTRDFTYIDDIIRVNKTLLQTDSADGEIMNVGSTDNIEIQTLAEEIRDQFAPDLKLEYAERHDADAEHTHADISKARKLIGYEPTTTIREGLEQFTAWYRENQDWYGPLVQRS